MRIKFESRSQQALTLRTLGYTYSEITKIMKLGKSNPGSYLKNAKDRGLEPLALDDAQLAGIFKKYGAPNGVPAKVEMEVDDNGGTETEVAVEPKKPAEKEKPAKKKPGRPAAAKSKKAEKVVEEYAESVAKAEKVAKPKAAKKEKKDVAKTEVAEKKPKAPAVEKESESDSAPESDFTLGQEVTISAKWQGRSFDKKGKIMGFLDPGQEIKDMFEKPPAKKNVFGIGDITQPRLFVMSEVGRIKTYFDPTEDMVKA